MITLSSKEVYEKNNEKLQELFVALVKKVHTEDTEKRISSDIEILLEKDPSTLSAEEKQRIREHLS